MCGGLSWDAVLYLLKYATKVQALNSDRSTLLDVVIENDCGPGLVKCIDPGVRHALEMERHNMVVNNVRRAPARMRAVEPYEPWVFF